MHGHRAVHPDRGRRPDRDADRRQWSAEHGRVVRPGLRSEREPRRRAAFPQSLTVDLGTAQSVSRIVLKLPPSSAWQTRTRTLTVSGSTDGSAFTAIVGSTGYTFNPATGNTTTITFAAASRRFLRLTFTAITGCPAGQVSEWEVYAS